MTAAQRAADHGQMAIDLMKAATSRATCPDDLVESMTGMAIVHAQAALRCARQAAKGQPVVLCPGCSGEGVLTDDPFVYRCQGCGGIFTDSRFPITGEQAIKFVAYHLPMLANAGDEGTFYFDLDITRPSDGGRGRMHGWADKRTKRVVQFG